MRLVKYTAAGFTLVNYPSDKKLPQYAVLSHTWGAPSQEVTFDDLNNGVAETKAGYAKLVFCARQAERDGLRSITSMFKWYQKAERCYVYLSDVLAKGGDALRHLATAFCKSDVRAKGDDAPKHWVTTFRKSRWFTRGWTLQELLAPSSVEFFSKDDVRLGDKRSLGQIICEITGIPLLAMEGDLLDFPVEERLRWAKTRETAEEEDLAYCLWGIFGVSSFVNYGEGKEAAFRRLEQDILLRNSHSPITQNKDVILVAFEQNTAFTGRGDEMKQLRQLATSGQAKRTEKVAITGLGGVGKTQLALEFVFQRQREFRECAVFWVSSVSKETIEQDYRKIAQELGISGYDDSKANPQTLLRDYWSKPISGRWILVYDNVDDIRLWEELGLIDCLPQNKLGTIIFTTRDKKTAVRLADANVITLSNMDKESSLALLRNYLVRKDLVKIRVKDTEKLLDQLACLPLALVQAAKYINEKSVTIRDYLDLLDDREEQVIELLSVDFNDDWRYHDVNIHNPVALTWLSSFKRLQEQNTLAANYLSFMACVDSRNIPLSLLPSGSSSRARTEAIGALNNYSLISQESNGLITMHRLVHIATRNWLRKNQTLETWMNQAVEKLEGHLDSADMDHRELWWPYMPHAYFALTLQKDSVGDEYDSPMYWLKSGFVRCLCVDERYAEAEHWQAEILKATKAEFAADHIETLGRTADLAWTYMQLGELDEAEELQVLIKKTYETTLGTNHTKTLHSIGNLAITYMLQDRFKETEELQVGMVEAYKTTLGTDHKNTLKSMAELAETYQRLGRWKEAEKMQVTVMEAWKTKLGLKRFHTLFSMTKLTDTYRLQGRWKDAEDLDVHVMKTQEAKLGPDHPDTLHAMRALAGTYIGQGRLSEAEDLAKKALQGYKATLGPYHRGTLASMSILAESYMLTGRLRKAEELQVRVVKAYPDILRNNSLGTLLSRNRLATTLIYQCRWSEAEKLEIQVLEGFKKKFGTEHPDTLRSMRNLALTWRHQGRPTDALELMRACFEAGQRVNGAEHPETHFSMETLRRWEKENASPSKRLSLLVRSSASYFDRLRGKGGKTKGNTL